MVCYLYLVSNTHYSYREVQNCVVPYKDFRLDYIQYNNCANCLIDPVGIFSDPSYIYRFAQQWILVNAPISGLDGMRNGDTIYNYRTIHASCWQIDRSNYVAHGTIEYVGCRGSGCCWEELRIIKNGDNDYAIETTKYGSSDLECEYIPRGYGGIIPLIPMECDDLCDWPSIPSIQFPVIRKSNINNR